MVNSHKFLETIILISEKAAEISRIVRSAYWKTAGNGSSSRVIETESKSDEDRTDFKTLADVLIQAVITREVHKQLPGIGSIDGEENDSFQGGAGGNVVVKIKDSAEETSTMLSEDHDVNTVTRLSSLIHAETTLPLEHSKKLFLDKSDLLSTIDLDLSKLGIWIDPIDATTQYVRGRQPFYENGLFHIGLQCVTIIIGFYDISNGKPVAGVINRPFNLATAEDRTKWDSPERWSSDITWSICGPDSANSVSNVIPFQRTADNKRLTIAASAGERMWSVMTNPTYSLISPRGAGNKVLAVATGHADLYLITTDSNTVYRWDVCAGDAILRTRGGAIISFKPAFENFKLHNGNVDDYDFSPYQIDYRGNHDALSDGIVCYCDKRHVITLFRDMQEAERG